jgi:hypothetical protein
MIAILKAALQPFFGAQPLFLRCALALAMIALLASPAPCHAAPPATPLLVPPDKGAVDRSGKFVPFLPNPDTNKVPATRAEAEAALKQALNVHQSGPDSFQVGLVEFDKKNRTITLPARVNMRTQVLEYALVTESGKVHESLLATTAKPMDIQLAFLLLGASPAELTGDFKHAAVVPLSNSVSVEVSWVTNGIAKRYPLSDLILLRDELPPQPARAFTIGLWLYNGSKFDSLGFMAQREGSIISLIRDLAALVNNPGADRDNDQIHFPNEMLLPAQGFPVRATLRLGPPAIAVIPGPIPRGVTPITPLSTN